MKVCIYINYKYYYGGKTHEIVTIIELFHYRAVDTCSLLACDRSTKFYWCTYDFQLYEEQLP